jgi:hypothetical protein
VVFGGLDPNDHQPHADRSRRLCPLREGCQAVSWTEDGETQHMYLLANYKISGDATSTFVRAIGMVFGPHGRAKAASVDRLSARQPLERNSALKSRIKMQAPDRTLAHSENQACQ